MHIYIKGGIQMNENKLNFVKKEVRNFILDNVKLRKEKAERATWVLVSKTDSISWATFCFISGLAPDMPSEMVFNIIREQKDLVYELLQHMEDQYEI